MEDQKGYHLFKRVISSLLLATGIAGCIGYSGYLLLTSPNTPLPNSWNPIVPLSVTDPVTPMTKLKLRIALSTPVRCLHALKSSQAQFSTRADFELNSGCNIRNRVSLEGLAGSALSRVETTCETALRLTMWERHGVQQAARKHFGTGVAEIHHIGSYNCRAIRGFTTRMSTHATASAIDIRGFTLEDGRTIDLIDFWRNAGPEGAFLRDARDAACRWFQTTLGPDYNSLHKDHFHMQSRGWGICN